ncbi:MAG: alpha/beta fold hydrolase [Acidobacteria bacterium]|nr:alpha/beta fold hydrolase [Acidobacteriota bacterium]
MRPFRPLVPNPDFLTIAANFWPRGLDTDRFPVTSRFYRTEPEVRIRVEEQHPGRPPRGELVLVHGLESSSQAGYVCSMAQAALEAGYAVHRMNLRSCGGTEHLCRTMYHAGLTGDLRFLLERLRDQGRGPVFVAGYSLGGNLALKLAGELGAGGARLMQAVCAVCVPIDLAACARRLAAPRNRLYETRFLRKMRERIQRRGRIMPEIFGSIKLDGIGSLWEFDDRITAPAFGFGGAEHYYRTQSALRFMGEIRIPALVVAAEDDPIVPVEVFRHPVLDTNAALRFEGVAHGGHLGFLARRRPRFWLDGEILDWIAGLGNKPGIPAVVT